MFKSLFTSIGVVVAIGFIWIDPIGAGQWAAGALNAVVDFLTVAVKSLDVPAPGSGS